MSEARLVSNSVDFKTKTAGGVESAAKIRGNLCFLEQGWGTMVLL